MSRREYGELRRLARDGEFCDIIAATRDGYDARRVSDGAIVPVTYRELEPKTAVYENVPPRALKVYPFAPGYFALYVGPENRWGRWRQDMLADTNQLVLVLAPEYPRNKPGYTNSLDVLVFDGSTTRYVIPRRFFEPVKAEALVSLESDA